MKRLAAGVLVIVVAMLSACGGNDEPIDVVTPTPLSTPSPTSTDTLSQAELSAMAEDTYRTFFAEWTRLEREGGAEEPTLVLLENGAGPYLESVMELLREQRDSGTTVSGLAVAKVIPAPGGDFQGIDPKLTLRVCEDHSNGTYTREGVTYQGEIREGLVYLGSVNGRTKVMGGDTQLVDACSV